VNDVVPGVTNTEYGVPGGILAPEDELVQVPVPTSTLQVKNPFEPHVRPTNRPVVAVVLIRTDRLLGVTVTSGLRVSTVEELADVIPTGAPNAVSPLEMLTPVIRPVSVLAAALVPASAGTDSPPTMGWFRWWPPRLPKNCASPNEKTPPSEAIIQ
jgi:hypothetical protein